MYCHQYFFGCKYDLIQLHRQIIHQNDERFIETITISIFYSKSNVNNRNDMAAHSICAYLSFCQQPHKIELNSCQASADMPIEGLLHKLQIYSGVLL